MICKPGFETESQKPHSNMKESTRSGIDNLDFIDVTKHEIRDHSISTKLDTHV